MNTRYALAGGILLAGCATTPGARTHDMSAKDHSAAAERDDAAAQTHLTQYDPNARADERTCGGPNRLVLSGCWTSVVNPSKEHLEAAKVARRQAAEHRAASLDLRAAEERACSQVPTDDRDMSPFAHREDILDVAPMVAPALSPRSSPRLQGAIIRFRAVPGMTAEGLQKIVDCHIARNNAVGHEMPEMAFCPLGPKNLVATVAPSANGLAVSIRSEDGDSASEVLRRARALRP